MNARVPKLTGDARGLAVFRKQIASPCTKYKARKAFLQYSCVLWPYMLRSAFLTPKAVKFLQILLKVYIKRQISSMPT